MAPRVAFTFLNTQLNFCAQWLIADVAVVAVVVASVVAPVVVATVSHYFQLN